MKKFKAVFLCDNDSRIDYVYSRDQQKRIAEITELIPGSTPVISIPWTFQNSK